MSRGSRGDNRDGNGMLILVDAVLMEVQKRRGDSDNDLDTDEDPFGFNLLPGRSDGFVFFLLHGTGSVNCADKFMNLSRDLTLECTRVRRREGG